MIEKYVPTSADIYKSEVVSVDPVTHRKTTRGTEYVPTVSGTYKASEWVSLVVEAAVEDGLGDLLEGIKQYTRENCAWIHTEKDVEEHAARCLVNEAYKHWDDFNYQVGLF